jgi:hypothetical protein
MITLEVAGIAPLLGVVLTSRVGPGRLLAAPVLGAFRRCRGALAPVRFPYEEEMLEVAGIEPAS